MLQPEINSARIYAGAGSGPLLAAAAAWDGLADELRSAAASYEAVISGLTGGPWTGHAAVSMAAAAAPYTAWMSTTATQAELAGAQARSAVDAYEAAFAMTVPPPAIAANRSLLMSLVATNVLGQNTPAIAATEAHYGQMWAQDAATMYLYAGSSAGASTLAPFTPPQQTTDSAGLAAQAVAVGHATGAGAAADAQTVLSQATSAVPQILQGLASPVSSTSSTTSTAYASLLAALDESRSFLYPVSILSALPQRAISIANMSKSLMSTTSVAAKGVEAAGSAQPDGFASGAGILGSAAPTGPGAGGIGGVASASLGRVSSIGALSVPPTWGAAAPAAHPVATTLPGSGFGSTPWVEPGGPAGVPPAIAPITNMAGSRAAGAAPRYGFRLSVIARPPAGG